MRIGVKGLVAGALTLATLGSGGGVAQAQQVTIGADGKTAPVFSYVQATRERVWIPVANTDTDSNGVIDRIAIDIVRPKESGPTVKVPAIIDASPYYTANGRGNEGQRIITNENGTLDRFPLYYDNYFVPRGYAFIAAHSLGTAFSTGCVNHGGPTDIAGFKAVIDWLNGRVPGYTSVDGTTANTAVWHNGSSSMIGKSYDGTFANGVAATGVEGLKTIVPISAISAWYNYSRTAGIRHNNNYPSGLSNGIAGVRDDVGVKPPLVQTPTGPVTRQALCGPVRDAMDQLDGDEHGDINEYWRDRDHNKDANKVKASVFIVHGFQDDNVRMDHVGLWWDALKANSVKTKLWLLRTGHVDPFEQRRAVWVDTLHRWFDQELHGVANGIDGEPKVTIEDAPDVWGNYADWPIPGTQNTDVYLRAGANPAGAGTIGGMSGGMADTLTFQNTGANISENTLMGTPEGQQTNRRVFITPPLKKDVRLSGTAVLKLRAALGLERSNLSAVVAEIGTTTQILRGGNQDGVTDTTKRTCWGATSTDDNACPTLGAECTTTGIGVDNACYLEVSKNISTNVAQWRVTRGTLDSRQRNSYWYADAKAGEVVPGQFNDYTIPLQPTEHIFKAGNRISIIVTANLYGEFRTIGTPDTPGYVGSAISPAQEIRIDTRASKISLPIVGGSVALFDAGAFTDPQTTVSGTVPATLSLSLRGAATFDPFIPGVAQNYTATTTANVISTAGNATLSVSDPGRMTNGAFSLANPLQVAFEKSTWNGPVSNDEVDVTFTQAIGANDPLRTGTYSKTLTFTLSTTQP
ncbi:CocE/NonD family hydrolase [Solirubrobacter sp. CPCC 204708]|uniref:CocE/NonD family hydrolase n=1 Tax=Solirubrobacter deserti TaxID=2282478 RepID=A0ABT4RHI6_9ACTN|nr:CocE/NonD family hydrolase [Solirubrobacter deserti]MBE2316483.1 CocE/NonD family hydrolase [Solirubrobacter deserti]MDA0138016.1 CocE/NonD family hydrolase [Solirubrobacter deserti]